MTVLTGLEFKAKYGTEFYKVLNSDLIEDNHEYHLGINQDHTPFKPSWKRDSGGLGFTIKDNLIKWCYYDSFIGIIEIPDDAKVFVSSDEFYFKADKIILSKIITDEKTILQILKKPFEKKYIENNDDSKYLVESIEAKEKAFIEYKKTRTSLDLKKYLKSREYYFESYSIFVHHGMDGEPILIKLALNFINDVKKLICQ